MLTIYFASPLYIIELTDEMLLSRVWALKQFQYYTSGSQCKGDPTPDMPLFPENKQKIISSGPE